MNTKLTLRLDDALIREAKRYARKQGKSISQIVADYFRVIGLKRSAPQSGKRERGPLSEQLCGSLKAIPLSEKEYHRHLEEKHR